MFSKLNTGRTWGAGNQEKAAGGMHWLIRSSWVNSVIKKEASKSCQQRQVSQEECTVTVWTLRSAVRKDKAQSLHGAVSGGHEGQQEGLVQVRQKKGRKKWSKGGPTAEWGRGAVAKWCRKGQPKSATSLTLHFFVKLSFSNSVSLRPEGKSGIRKNLSLVEED